MVDRGPLLTSAIIFYLAIGAAIFEVLEEPHWKEAKKNYYTQKLHLLKEFPCLGQEGLDKILESMSHHGSGFEDLSLIRGTRGSPGRGDSLEPSLAGDTLELIPG
ncbi:Potassium channel sub K member 5 [Saguinus oedipus]|uniref:Potassium channel sub K member 5 n=1 Tax=Saguinus oedipus TaxID=9490 RepID=A0ABQ9VX12_SAGOE|nr:Potassium channel sub K member 5 [Saguinus oedipus]